MNPTDNAEPPKGPGVTDRAATRHPADRAGAGDLVLRIWFYLAATVLLVALGLSIARYRLFPYPLIEQPLVEVEAAAAAVRELVWPTVNPIATQRSVVETSIDRRLTVHDRARAFPGLTFFTGSDGDRHFARLIDMGGATLHEWRVSFGEVWPDPPHVLDDTAAHRAGIHGAHLYPNGDVLLILEGGVFPMGGGLVKLNRRSEVVWSVARNIHHDLHVAENGTIFAAAHRFVAADSAAAAGAHAGLRPPYYDDDLLVISPAGEVVREISMIAALERGGHQAVYLNGLAMRACCRKHPVRAGDLFVDDDDPLHLNSVETLPAALAAAFPMFEAGDALVSFRQPGVIAVIDLATATSRWVMSGRTIYQHHPHFTPDGTIVIFDNWGGDPAGNRSRLVEIDPASQRVVWQYAGTEDAPFFSEIRGKTALLPNGNLLVASSHQGRLFEVTRDADTRIVWEYYNVVPERPGELGWVADVMRFGYGELGFVDGG